MTINSSQRRTRRTLGYGSKGNGEGQDRVTVGEKLRDAREVRGLDLYRVERDTKIRHKFLAALEAGDYADLPGDVYARGFLRNYATYLGLDPDEIIEEWRGEFSNVPPAPSGAPILGAPRPMLLPRRGFFLQTSHMVLIAVVLIVAMVGIYFGYQVSRFLSYPTLAIGCPGSPGASTSGLTVVATGTSVSTGTAGATGTPGATETAAPTDVAGATGASPTPQASGTAGSSSCSASNGVVHITAAIGATTYYLSGSATAGSTVSIRWNAQDPKTVPVDDGGKWSYQAVLSPGQNEFDITAQNIDTNHSSKAVVVYVYVPSPTPTPPTPVVAFTAPNDGASITDGNIVVNGTSSYVTDVTLTVAYLGTPPAPGATLSPSAYASAAPLFTPTPSASSSVGPSMSPNPSASAGASASVPPSQGPLSTPVMSSGDFTFGLTLSPGVWRLTISGQDTLGRKSVSVSRLVAVPFAGLIVGLKIVGTDSAWVQIKHDGITIKQATQPAGWTTSITAKKNVCISSGKPAYVQLTVNGVDMGTIAKYGGSKVYIDATHPPKNVTSCP